MKRFEESQINGWKELGDRLRGRREEMFLSVGYCSGMCGLSVATYDELETCCDEFFGDISLGTARRICVTLNLDLFDIVERFWGRPISLAKPSSAFDFYSRTSGSLSKAKTSSGISDERFEEETGWDVKVIRELERTPDYVESLPIYALIYIAETLGINAGSLIGVPPLRS